MTISLNPRADQVHPSDAPREATGPVAADSLAAESLQKTGGFAENENAHVMGVKGAQSTLNTTDTQAATALPPASHGTVREKQEALAAGTDEKGTTGLKLDAIGQAEFDGHHSQQGYVGGSGDAKAGGSSGVQNVKAGDSDFGASGLSTTGGAGQKDPNIRSTGSGFSGSGGANNTSSSSTATTTNSASSSNSSSGPEAGTGVRPHVDAAPTYTNAVTGSGLSESTFKPKGQNLEDANETQSIPQTKTFTGDVGGVHDPGRLAEREFEGRNTDPNTELGQAGEEGGRQRNAAGEGRGGQYDVLESERA